MTRGERVREIRKVKDLTLEKFGEQLGVTKTTISRIEKGVNNLTDQMAKGICREYNVNEDWLLNGEGDMFIEQTRDEEIEDFVGRLLSNEEDSFKKRLVSVLAALDEDEWETLEKIAISLQEKRD